MPELIDKKRTEAKVFLIARFFIDRPDREVELVKAVIHRCCEEIDKQPTIEAEPVRRGHWVLTRDEEYEYCHCSECGYDTGENWMIGSEIPYCSQCGSKNYDGGADNDSE